jgi:hypothetical protein
LGDLFDLLLQILKQRRGKKVKDGDLQPVADLFDSRNGRGIVSTANDIVQCGLCNATDGRKLIQGNIALATQLQYAKYDCFIDIHAALLTLVG